MGIRKNAKYLTATEKENLIRAFVMMKADPVPGRPYNWFDGFALIHRYIQNTAAPDVPGPSTASASVNFGHNNAAFGPWHRYFLFRFE
ncbi:MAG TPA: tyrosinase family protein, partial [Lysobacter sp.]|nr:tyrosinase family protein [Lysobacter sp.]